MSNPVFQESSASSKIITVIKELRKLKVGPENMGLVPKARGFLTWSRVGLESLGLIQEVLDSLKHWVGSGSSFRNVQQAQNWFRMGTHNRFRMRRDGYRSSDMF